VHRTYWTVDVFGNCIWKNRHKKPINEENKNFVNKQLLPKSQHEVRIPQRIQVANPDTVYKEHPVTSSTI